MSRRWNWDFEDAHLPRPKRARARPITATPPREIQIRRRRAGAGLVVVIVVAILLAALTSSHHQASSAARAAVGGTRAQLRPPSEPENDQNAAVASVLSYTPFVRSGSGRAREVALTFDDGPGPYTPRVLDVLERFHVHATFFVIGKMLRYFAASTVREIEDGDVIGDHTETHPMLAHLSAHEQYEELFEQIARVELLGGQRPVLFRPPYGSFNAATWRQLHKLHLLMVLWSVDTNDYRQPGVSAIVQEALNGAHPGAILLMHDAGGTRTQTIEALPLIINGLRARGYSLVTVPRLLMDDPPATGQPMPTNLSGD